MPPMKMTGTDTAAAEIFEKIGDLSNVELYFGTVLVAVYVRPEKTQSGLYLPDKTRDEDKYQGKAHLVVKVGPRAFVDDGPAEFHGQSVDVGDWVAFKPSDAWDIHVNGQLCRIIKDVNVKMRVSAPDVVW